MPGIGEKTAARLVAARGTLDAVLAAPELPPSLRRRLDGARDYLAAARQVVPPRTDVPLPDTPTALPSAGIDATRLAALVTPHRLDGVVARLRQALAAARPDP